MSIQDNPFTPPSADSSARARRRGSAAWAVLAGVLADIGGSLLVGILMTIIAAAMLVADGTPPEQVEQALVNPDPTSWFSIVGYLMGCAFSVLGGYLCARIAGYAEYRLAGLVAAIAIAFGLLVSLFAGGGASIPLNVSLALLTVGSVMLGAWRGAVRNQRVAAD